MKNSFSELGITAPILKALEEMGFESPTEVQGRAIPHILNNEDLIVMSKTGSGKTAVFGVSILQMTDPDIPGPQALILEPTRELAVQVDNDLRKMSKHLSIKTTSVYGQHSMNAEMQALSKGVSIISGTPGRVYDHIGHGNIKTKNIRFLVLDEADRMLDMGFYDQVVRIVKALPKNRITLLFSATIPAEIRRICRDHMKNPETIEIESQTKTVDTTEQLYYRVDNKEKNNQLNRLLIIEQPESCMIFCNTKIAVDRVQSYLSRKGYAVEALHGDIPQSKRMKTMEQFKQGQFHLLVATDVAARGIHIEGLSLVINYDVPQEKDSYVHRIGRTGRAGKAGRAISLVTGEDIMSLYEIEEHIGAMIAEADLPAEVVFNECRANAEKWLEENTIKVRPSVQKVGNTGASTKGGHKKPVHRSRDSAQVIRSAVDSRPQKKTGSEKSGLVQSGSAQSGFAQSRSAQPGSGSDRPYRRSDSRPSRQAGMAQHGVAGGRPYRNADADTGLSRDTGSRPYRSTGSGSQREKGIAQHETSYVNQPKGPRQPTPEQNKSAGERVSFIKRLFNRLLGK